MPAPHWRCATANAPKASRRHRSRAEQLIQVRRPEDQGNALWMCFQRIQEHLTRGGLPGRTVQGRRMHTREVASIDRNVALNRALWVLAEEMRKLKA